MTYGGSDTVTWSVQISSYDYVHRQVLWVWGEIYAVSSPRVGFKGFRPRHLSIVPSRRGLQWQFSIVRVSRLVQCVREVRLRDFPERVGASVRPHSRCATVRGSATGMFRAVG